jgi:cytochrome c oxidase assembly protein subunit 15
VAHRLALTTIVATFVLILFGGLVTNTGSALAVPDWPTTFGYNMFLYPWSEMVGGIFYEHSHRLLGSLVGLLTLALAALLWRAGGTLRWLGLVAVAAVIVQGILGGLRVVLLKETLAIVHGCLAQAYFALAVVIAVLTSSRHQTPVQGIDPPSRTLAIAAAALVYLQIVFGALITHAGWIWVHVAGAVAVFVFVPIVTARLRRSGDVLAAPAALVLLILLGIQLLLGVGSFISRFTPVWIPGGQLTMLALPVAHRLAASVILGAAVVAAVRASGFGAPRRASAGGSLESVRTAAGRPPLRLVRG